MEDRRNKKTEQLIKRVFLNLLKEKSLNKITVSEISRQADLGRGTFYLHYSDVYDLYESIENEVINDLKGIFQASYPTTDAHNSLRLTESLIEYVERRKDLFTILMRSNEGNTMYKIKKVFYSDVVAENSKINPSMDDQYSLIESIFVVSGIIGVLERWIVNDFKTPSVSIAEMLNAVISKVNRQ